MQARTAPRMAVDTLTCGLLIVVLLHTSPAVAGDPMRVALVGGPVHVLRDLTQLHRPSTAPANRVCSGKVGDTGVVLETFGSDASPAYWVRIRFDSGGCDGKEGWVGSDVVRVQ